MPPTVQNQIPVPQGCDLVTCHPSDLFELPVPDME